jgi:hypothetical protein
LKKQLQWQVFKGQDAALESVVCFKWCDQPATSEPGNNKNVERALAMTLVLLLLLLLLQVQQA